MNIRCLALMCLALFLRYTTFIEPPDMKHADSHIIPILIHVLRESMDFSSGSSPSTTISTTTNKVLDIRFRRYAIAALGEIVFYISAQDTDENSTNINDNKLTLSQDVISMICKCLMDDNDEIIKHYAVKTIENVVTQGSIYIRRRFATWEIACRSYDIAQHCRNVSLQVYVYYNAIYLHSIISHIFIITIYLFTHLLCLCYVYVIGYCSYGIVSYFLSFNATK
jgi:hypothetical protein